VLHDEQDQPVFDTVVVVSDRRVIDRQLQQAVRQFEKTRGVVETIDKDSQQLKEALETGKPVVVTTLQKFPVISRQVGDLPGQRFAVIVDEAHSSQSGATTQHLNRTLAVSSLEEAAKEEDQELEDMEDILVEEMTLRRHLPNVSTFALTATPKPKTLQLFGHPGPDGKPRPFSLYPMRQAIDEDFILDVLKNYTAYKSYWRLLKKVEDDPRCDRAKAQRLLKSFVELSDHAVGQKVAIMVEHFAHHVAHRIDSQAKAMIVTRSRLRAVRYKLATDQYLQEHGYPFKSLVAFSGTVNDGDNDYTETGMNTASAGVRIPQSATASTFKKSEYRLLIVANKFQTGFDQPLLHTMYVDKQLGGVDAVQTLSRLNRIYPPHKRETMVLDFVNGAEHIQKAFEPFYEATLLSEETDPNVLYQLQDELDEFHFYTDEEIDEFVEVYFKGDRRDLSRLYGLLAPVMDRFEDASPDEQEEFRSSLNDFVRLYAFLAQILPFVETDWEKRYHFGRLLLRRLPVEPDRLPVELKEKVTLNFYRTQQTFEGSIQLQRGDGELAPVGRGSYGAPDVGERDPLSVIIEDLNKTFGIKTNHDAEAAIEQLQGKLQEDIALQKSFEVNPPETARLTFDQATEELFAEMIDSYWGFYKQVTDDPQAKQRFFDWLHDQYRRQAEGQDEHQEGDV
jgi:type I restriction enzyme R subunit